MLVHVVTPCLDGLQLRLEFSDDRVHWHPPVAASRE